METAEGVDTSRVMTNDLPARIMERFYMTPGDVGRALKTSEGKARMMMESGEIASFNVGEKDELHWRTNSQRLREALVLYPWLNPGGSE